MARPNVRANGATNVSTFVKVDSSSSNRVIQAGAGDFPIGISQEFAGVAPIPGASQNATTNAGDPITVYSTGEIALLQSTSAGWTANDLLKSDANGKGVVASTNDYYGALALSTVSGVGTARVLVILGKK